MKRILISAAALVALLPAFAACGKKAAYSDYLSEIKRDVFCGEAEGFSVVLSCSERETPYASDGIVCPLSKVAEISLVAETPAEYSVFVEGEKDWGGETSYRNVKGDYYYSQGLDVFPENSVNVRIEWEGGGCEIAATSVKTAKTLSPEAALERAVAAEKETVEALTEDGVFQGEFRVRLLRRDANFYYVGIVDKTGKTVSLLLDAESGEVLARREMRFRPENSSPKS